MHSSAYNNCIFTINYRPVSTLRLVLEPEYTVASNELQYIDNLNYGSDSRYLFGRIHQKTFRLSFRVNYNLTPDFTIQYWGQPFNAAGDYSSYKMITNPKAAAFGDRYQIYNPNQISYFKENDIFIVDENLDETEDYRFSNPNFNSDTFLSNLVLRWEFIPGSTLYLVWSQKREYSSTLGKFSINNDMHNLLNGDKPYNVFLIKFSYRIGLH
jgi:hypothetical protein